MIATMMIYSLVIGAVLGLGALLADLLARRAGISQRFVWSGALALLVVLTLSAPWRVSEQQSVLLPAATVGEVNAATLVVADEFSWTTLVDRAASALRAPGEMLSSLIGRATIDVSPAMNGAIGATWAVLAAVLFVLLALTLRRLDVQRRRMPHAELHGVSVRVGTSDGPAVYGVLSPEIVVPSALLSRSHDEQQLVLAHEDEHRRARDPLLLAMTAGFVALLPWHPVAWWCASRVRLATELDCDARVLSRGTSARRYGALLLTVAETMSSAPRPKHALALLDSRRHLERRILAMTTRKTRRTPLASGALALIGASAVFAACNTDIPTAAEVRDADAQSVVRQLGLPSGSGQIVYYVDGQRMAEAETVPAEEIASIEVRRKRTAGEISEVHIRRLGAEETELRRVPYKTALESDSVRVTLGRTRYVGEEEARARASDSLAAREIAMRASRVQEVRRRAHADSMNPDGAGVASRSVLTRRDVASGTVDTLRLSPSWSVRSRGDTMTITQLARDGSSGATSVRQYYEPMRTGGARGDSAQVVIRGASLSTREPLIIIDGIISNDANILKRLDPNRIESIEVIKGETASKIHGPRGADGVISITTKKK